MPKSAYKILRKSKTGKKLAKPRYYRIKPNGQWKFMKEGVWKAAKKRAGTTTKKTKKSNRRTKSQRSKTSSRPIGGRKKMARGNGSSYSKQNIAIGTALTQIAPRLAPTFAGFLPLVGLIPRVPTALKVMSWGLAAKQLSDSMTMPAGSDDTETDIA
jgi:hypothetical protein